MSGHFMILVTICLLGAHIKNAEAADLVLSWTTPPIPSGSASGVFVAKFPENTAVSTSVTGVKFAATAAGVTLIYSSTAQEVAGMFNVLTTGEVQLATGQSLDFETKTSYTITVTITDSAVPLNSATVTATVSIDDINEGTPTFSTTTQTVCIKDNSPAGTTLATLKATDTDTAHTIKHSIDSGNTDLTFTIDDTTGVITVASSKTISAAATASYTLIIKAVDNGLPAAFTGSATITATVSTVCSGTVGVTVSVMLVLWAVVASLQQHNHA